MIAKSKPSFVSRTIFIHASWNGRISSCGHVWVRPNISEGIFETSQRLHVRWSSNQNHNLLSLHVTSAFRRDFLRLHCFGVGRYSIKSLSRGCDNADLRVLQGNSSTSNVKRYMTPSATIKGNCSFLSSYLFDLLSPCRLFLGNFADPVHLHLICIQAEDDSDPVIFPIHQSSPVVGPLSPLRRRAVSFSVVRRSHLASATLDANGEIKTRALEPWSRKDTTPLYVKYSMSVGLYGCLSPDLLS